MRRSGLSRVHARGPFEAHAQMDAADLLCHIAI